MSRRVIAYELSDASGGPGLFLKFIDPGVPTAGGIEAVPTNEELAEIAEVVHPVLSRILESRLNPQDDFLPSGVAKLEKDRDA